jgi:hypothetical protein
MMQLAMSDDSGDDTSDDDGSDDDGRVDKQDDVLFVHGASENGESYHVLRQRNGQLEAGELRGVQEGRPIMGDLVKLTPRKEHGLLFNVEVLASAGRPKTESAPSRAPARPGPAQVATDAYRANWDAIFGARRVRGSLN